ncbi:winged helix-turn-helix domain-containing protein [Thermodesulfobacteriota bacterium]
MNQEKKAKKEALKKLLAERKAWIKKAAAKMKKQKKEIKAIKEQLQNNPATVPMISEATEISSDKVLWYIAALKKYGQIIEGEKDGGYYHYLLSDSTDVPDDDIEETTTTRGAGA